MELHDFLKKFLPDHITDLVIREYGYEPEGFYRYFHKALANYTDLICEKQREDCFENFMVGDIALKTAILNAPQPKIDEL